MLLLAIIKKELLLISRDRSGLLVLFVMPMLLVLVLTLIQDNVFRATGESATQALFVNQDQGELGEDLAARLKATGAIEIVEEFSGQQIDPQLARLKVYEGDYQFAIIVPSGFSQQLKQSAEQTIQAALRKDTAQKDKSAAESVQLQLIFDPTVRGVYRTAVTNALQRGLLGLEISQKGEVLGGVLSAELEQNLKQQMGEYIPFDLAAEIPQLSPEWASHSLIRLDEESAYPEKFPTLPTSVQQNVPAWTLFGMFFIVIPLAGTIIRERQEGTLTRLMTMPVGSARLLLGKVVAYQLICLLQMLLMLAVGKFILPLLGAPTLELGSAPWGLILVALSAALAACGYGILVGVLAKSYDQASTFGSVSVVIAAALGGVMVPVYVMPKVMQQLSVLSPLGWGLDAFLDIFVRNGSAISVLPRVAALTGFFLLCLLLAALFFWRWRRRL